MVANRTLSLTAVILSAGMWIAAGAHIMQKENLGPFTDASSVGQTPPGCKVQFSPETGEYRITGGGNNIWETGDDFYFVWKKVSGDVTLTADVQFVGTSAAEHRKAVLMVRQSLERDSAYADVASHGNGLTSLQFRGFKGEHTYQIFTQLEQPARIRIVRQGSRFTMYSGKPGQELTASSPVEYVSLKDPVYVGLGVCSHVATALETAVFSHVKLEETGSAKRPPIVGVAHIGLKTNNMEAARQFYGHALGYSDFSLGTRTYFKVNDHQYVELTPDLESATQDRLSHVAFETTDAKQLRDYLASRKVEVPATLQPGPDGNLSFTIKDADGHEVEFVQYMPGSLHSRNFGKLVPEARVSKRMIHVGFTVKDRAAADALFKDVLGFETMWYGGRTEDRVDYVDMRVPEGSDWLEYMLNVQNPSSHTLGVMNHLALGVPSIQPAYHAVLDRGLTPPQPPKIGVDGKWQLNLYDPNDTRAELMEFAPVQTPCCSPMHLPAVVQKQ